MWSDDVDDDDPLYAIGVTTSMSLRTGSGAPGEEITAHPSLAPSTQYYDDLAFATERRDVIRHKGIQLQQIDVDMVGGVARAADDNLPAIEALRQVPVLDLASIERAVLLVALGRARSKRHAAALLGVTPGVLERRLFRHRIVWGPALTQ